MLGAACTKAKRERQNGESGNRVAAAAQSGQRRGRSAPRAATWRSPENLGCGEQANQLAPVDLPVDLTVRANVIVRRLPAATRQVLTLGDHTLDSALLCRHPEGANELPRLSLLLPSLDDKQPPQR